MMSRTLPCRVYAQAALGFILLACATVALAASVRVMALHHDRAEVQINGESVRTLWVGETAPEGVTLRAVEQDTALIEADGKLWRLQSGQSTFAQSTLKANTRGMFVLLARVNGAALPALIDTGATSVAINSEDASRLGIDYWRGERITTQTANGPAAAYRVTLASVQVGDIALANVQGVVIEGGRASLPLVLIGMSFLREVDMLRSGDTLVLQRRH